MDKNFTPNISLSAITKETNNSDQVEETQNSYDPKNYVDTFLSDGEKSKTIEIRILPSSATNMNPFTHVHFHSFKLSQKQTEDMKSKTPFKSFVCLNPKYNTDLDQTLGPVCPFCEKSKKLFAESEKEGLTKAQVKELRKEALSLYHIDEVIMRCIVRGKEDEGVKFLKIKTRKDGADAFNKILNICKQRNEEYLSETGQEKNILDLYNGRDFVLTITPGLNNKGVTIDVTDKSIDKPLSTNNQQILDWVNDPKQWTDVYGVKPADYLQLILDGKTPWFDKYGDKKWVDSDIIKSRIEERKKNAQDAIDEATSAILNEHQVSAEKVSPTVISPTVVSPKAVNTTYAETTIDDDLPF